MVGLGLRLGVPPTFRPAQDLLLLIFSCRDETDVVGGVAGSCLVFSFPALTGIGRLGRGLSVPL